VLGCFGAVVGLVLIASSGVDLPVPEELDG
jgi:hypothetical protein